VRFTAKASSSQRNQLTSKEPHPTKMNYVKSNAMPLVVGLAVGYFLAKNGGLKASVAKVGGTVRGAV
jgi:hypothetical protein